MLSFSLADEYTWCMQKATSENLQLTWKKKKHVNFNLIEMG